MIENIDYFIIDNWYDDPYQIRKNALELLEFSKIDYRIPGIRSNYVPLELLIWNKEKLETILNKKIDETFWIHFNCLDLDKVIDQINFSNPLSINGIPISNTGTVVDNGRFQLITEKDKQWDAHQDTTNWASVIYLTPDSPKDCGTSFYKEVCGLESFMSIENVFNRCIIYNSKIPHKSSKYFGTDNNTGRLSQTFFFNLKEGLANQH